MAWMREERAGHLGLIDRIVRRPTLYILTYTLALGASTWLLVRLQIDGRLIYLFAAVCAIAASFYRRLVYLPMAVSMVVAATFVDLCHNVPPARALTYGVFGLLSTVVAVEGYHWSSQRHRRIRKALRRERDFAESLIDTAQAIVLAFDREGHVMRTNPFTEALVGYRREELIGQDWISLCLPQELQAAVWDHFQAALTGESTRGTVVPILDRDGHRHQIAWYDHPLSDQDGHIIGLLSVGHDVTARLTTEAALKERETLYRLLVEHQAEGISMVNPDDESFVFVNPAGHQIFGVPNGELAGRTLKDFTAPEDFERVQAETAQRRAGITSTYEMTIHRPDGTTRRILVTAVPHYDEAGQLRNTIGIFRDITERMEAQATLRRRAAQLAVLNDIGREITGELSLEGLQQRAVELVQATFGYEHVTLLRLMLDTDQIQMVARAGEFAVLGPPDHTLDLGQGIIGWVCRHGETIVADDVRVDPRYLNLYPDRVQTRSELCVPIWVAGEVVGALDVQSTEIESFDENDVMVLETVADQVGVAIGNARLYSALRQDIEDRRKVETALRESQERLSLALEGGGLGPWDFNVQDKTIVYSRRWAEVLDYGPDEMPRHFDDWQALVHPDDRDQAKAKLNAHLDGKAPVYAAEYRIRAKDGTWRWLYSRGRVIGWDDEGRPLRAVGTHLDITQRKESEITLRELNTKLETLVSERTTELERERDKSNAILETTGDAIALVDRELAIEYVNPAFEDVTGYGAEEVCGLPIHKIVNPSYVPQDVITGMRRTVALEVDWDGEMPLRRKNGTTYDALIHIAPVRDGAGTVIGYLTSHRDISDLKALQRLQTRFINNVSHELRTPITILKLYAQMLSDAPPDKLTEYRQALVTEIDHLSNLVSDILRLNTVDSGNLELKPAPVSLNNLIKRRISQIWPTHDCEASPRLRLELSDPSPVALADPDWLLEALRHLLDNARDYTPSSGSVTILAGERAHGDQTWATITIQDTGSGIPQQELPLIFDRFFRGQQADDDQVSGTGLGLSLTKAIIGLQDGRITVESTLGSGSAFTVWLPIAPRRDDV